LIGGACDNAQKEFPEDTLKNRLEFNPKYYIGSTSSFDFDSKKQIIIFQEKVRN
jgi:hypothetical protein